MNTFRLKIRYKSDEKPYYLVFSFPLWTVDEAISNYLNSSMHTALIENDILEEMSVEWGKIIDGHFKIM